MLLFLFQGVIILAQERGYEEKEFDRLNQLDAYDYEKRAEETPKQDLGWLQRLLKGIAGIIEWLFSSPLGYLLLAGLIGMVIYAVVKNSQGSIRHPGEKVAAGDALVITDEKDFDDTDWQSLIDKARSEGNYRLAIRYMYLLVLRDCHRHQFIEWKMEKTNYNYLDELPDVVKPDFSRLLYLYEYVWYGEFEATSELLAQVEVAQRATQTRIR